MGRRTLELNRMNNMLTSSTQWVYEGRLLHTAAWGNASNFADGCISSPTS